MSLSDTVAKVRSGVFQIVFLNADNERIGGGSAFLANGLLVTNHHVYVGYQQTHEVLIRQSPEQVTMSSEEFASRLVTGSTEQSYDYAVLRVPEIVKDTNHDFTLEAPGQRRIGDPIALLGFPLEHENLTCHQGIISSFYNSGIAKVIQIDASVNAGNSGGPLIDPIGGTAFGIVTRKATGLTQIFVHLRESIEQNAKIAAAAAGRVGIAGIDPNEALAASQRQMLLTLSEIERQANVGIGYAFSAEHVLNEACLRTQNP